MASSFQAVEITLLGDDKKGLPLRLIIPKEIEIGTEPTVQVNLHET